jgi:hypothetical protein
MRGKDNFCVASGGHRRDTATLTLCRIHRWTLLVFACQNFIGLLRALSNFYDHRDNGIPVTKELRDD